MKETLRGALRRGARGVCTASGPHGRRRRRHAALPPLTRVEHVVGVKQLLQLPHELGGLGACHRGVGVVKQVA